MERTIVHTCFYHHPPAAVWELLTDSTLLSQWLMENNFKPRVGHKFQFKARARINPGFDGNIYCEVLEVVPEKRLVYTWRGGPGNGKITLDSVVTWTLTAKDGGTELLLEHAGFRGVKNYLAYIFMSKGWSTILKKRIPLKLNTIRHEAAKG